MAPQVGLEPTTLRLTAECSTAELLRNIFFYINIISLEIKNVNSIYKKNNFFLKLLSLIQLKLNNKKARK